MNEPDLYRKSMASKLMDRFHFLKEYSPIVRWRWDKRDSLLDIGCAGGDFTSEYIKTILPKTFSRLVGVDINENMINYARKNFEQPNVSFDVLDISGDITEFLKKYDRFDHITSILCLHLVPDQNRALKNMFELLTPNGNCLLYIIVEWPGQEIYKKMFPNWSQYMEDVDDFISYYHRSVNPTYMLKKNLENAGFSECKVTERRTITTYDDLQLFKDTFKSIIPFYNRVPLEMRDKFMQEFTDLLVERNNGTTSGSKEFNVILPYTFLAAYARKQ